MAEPLTPEEQQERYKEFLAQFSADGFTLQQVSVPVDDERLRVLWDGQPGLTEKEAQKAVLARLGVELEGELHSSARELDVLSKYILYSLPETAWTTNLINNLDVRPYMQNVVTYYDNGGAFFENKQLGKVQNREAYERATGVLEEANKVADETVKASQQSNNATPPPVDPTTAGLSVPAQVAGWTADVQAAAQQGLPGNKFKEWVTGGDALEMPTVSEQEIRDALSLSGSTDILDVMTVTGNYAEQGRAVPPQTVQMNDPLAPSSSMDPGGGQVPNKLSITAAAKYLQGPNVTPAMVKRLQDQLVRAGYMDGINARVVPGDGWDQATNMAWRRALADSYQRGVPLPQLLKEQEQQRTSGFKPLSGLAQRSMLDQVAQSVLGRNLNEQEQAHLIQQLYTLRDQPLSGPNADGSGGAMGDGMWFSESDVAGELLAEHGGEISGTSATNAMYSGQKMIEGMFK